MRTRSQSLAVLLLGGILLLSGGVSLAGPVNINTADAATLARELSGVGLKLAQAIVDYRQKHGPFKTPDDLALVKGIGKAAIARNRDLIRVDGSMKEGAKPPGEPTPSPSGQR